MCENLTPTFPYILCFKNGHLLLFDLMQVFAFYLRQPHPPTGEASTNRRRAEATNEKLRRKVHPPKIHLAGCTALFVCKSLNLERVGGNVWSSEDAFPISFLTRPTYPHRIVSAFSWTASLCILFRKEDLQMWALHTRYRLISVDISFPSSGT